LHLLENFAKSTPPDNPVEGQVWYDNTTANSLLKVYDGSNWVPTGSITKTITAPLATSSVNGDLWVNPATQQLYIFSGISWSLIGPQFSSGLKTGPVVDSVSDTSADINDVPHNIISLYSNNEQIAILSSDTFVPKAFITGFPKVYRGITLTTELLSTEAAKLVGTATTSDGLTVSGKEISASNFLRSDVKSTTNNAFEVKSDVGLTVGGDLSFNIGISANGQTVNLTSSNKNIQFSVKDTQNNVSPILQINTGKKVGINTANPTVDLDVNGAALVSSNLTVGVSTATTPGKIIANGGITASKVSTFNGEVKTTAGMTVSTTLGNDSNVPYPAIIPLTTDTYDIGSSTLKFKNIYATTLNGNLTGTLTGNVEGNVSGAAGYLKSAASIKLTGDMTSDAIPYNGKDAIEIKTSLSAGFITNKTAITESSNSDLMLVFRNIGNSSELKSITKSNFLASVPGVPIGSILPFAGAVPPTGYLLCDGSEILVSSYPALFKVIGVTYRPFAQLVGSGTFALPDLRGRFPLGDDSMNNTNLSKIQAKDGSGLVDPRGKRNGSIDFAEDANRVHNVNGKSVGGYSGNDTLDDPAYAGTTGAKLTTSALGSSYSTMNPYLTINYIIFTGVL
jgi:microcystin-dependent protein